MARISVRLTPRAGRDGIDGWRDGVLRARVTAAPVDGAANDALIRLLAKALGVAPSSVTVFSGASSRTKVLEIGGMHADAIAARLAEDEV